MLVDCLNAKLVVVGADFHFGHQRRGNVPLLEEMGRELGFEVLGMSLVGPDGLPARDEGQVSSTAIRRALVAGDLTTANAMLVTSSRCAASCNTATSAGASGAFDGQHRDP